HGMNVYIAGRGRTWAPVDFASSGWRFLATWDPKKFLEMQRRNPQIKREEYEFIKEKANLLKGIGMMASRNTRVSYQGISTPDVSVQGITENITAINNVQVSDAGHSISPEEAMRHARVAFIGNDLRTRFFEGRDPI